MVFAGAAPPGAQTARASPCAQPACSAQRRLLRLENRLPVAHAPARVPTLEDSVSLLQKVALGWYLGSSEPRDARTLAGAAWARSPTQRRDRGQPIGENYRRRGRAERLRRRQEGEGQEETSAGRHRRSGGGR